MIPSTRLFVCFSLLLVLVSSTFAAQIAGATTSGSNAITANIALPLSKVTLTANKISPQPVNTAMTLTATPTGGFNLEYKFYVARQVNGSWSWTVLRSFGAVPTCQWAPNVAGSYWLRVLAREVMSTNTYDQAADLYFTVGVPLTSVSLSANKLSPQMINTAITLTATPTGGGSLEYKFYVGRLVDSTWSWTVLRDYNTTSTCPWQPTLAGSYWLRVLARAVGSTSAYDKAADLYYTVNAPLTSVELTTSKPSPQAANTAITLTATPTGGVNLQYKFYVARQVNSSWSWTVLRDYGAGNTCPWQPTQPGSYWLRVLVREVGSTNAYDKADDLNFTVNPPLTALSLTVNKTPPRFTNLAMTLTATPTGGVNLEYKFYAGRQVNSTWSWTVLQDYNSFNSCPWTPTIAGSYWLRVLAREVGSANNYDKLADLYVTVVPSPYPAGTVVGTVTTDEGAPIAGVTVFTTDGVDQWVTTTDAGGTYALTGISAGERVISFSGAGWETKNIATVVTDGAIIVDAVLNVSYDTFTSDPVVTVDDPYVDQNSGMATITGIITNLDIEQGIIIVNGSASIMSTSGGEFSSVAILQPGVNTVYVYAVNPYGRDIVGPITIDYTPENTMYFRVTLVWDGVGDIDLHTWDPNMEHSCYWSMWIPTGALDIDNVEQDGPENFTCTTLTPGRFRIAVNSFSLYDTLSRKATIRVTVNSGPNAGRVYNFGPYTFTDYNLEEGYPVTGNTACWWRPCDVLVQGDTISAVAPDSTPLPEFSANATVRTAHRKK